MYFEQLFLSASLGSKQVSAQHCQCQARLFGLEISPMVGDELLGFRQEGWKHLDHSSLKRWDLFVVWRIPTIEVLDEIIDAFIPCLTGLSKDLLEHEGNLNWVWPRSWGFTELFCQTIELINLLVTGRLVDTSETIAGSQKWSCMDHISIWQIQLNRSNEENLHCHTLGKSVCDAHRQRRNGRPRTQLVEAHLYRVHLAVIGSVKKFSQDLQNKHSLCRAFEAMFWEAKVPWLQPHLFRSGIHWWCWHNCCCSMPLKLEAWNKPLKPDHQVIQSTLKLAMMTSKLVLKIGTLVDSSHGCFS